MATAFCRVFVRNGLLLLQTRLDWLLGGICPGSFSAWCARRGYTEFCSGAAWVRAAGSEMRLCHTTPTIFDLPVSDGRQLLLM
jgi:hypothetical protein